MAATAAQPHSGACVRCSSSGSSPSSQPSRPLRQRKQMTWSGWAGWGAWYQPADASWGSLALSPTVQRIQPSSHGEAGQDRLQGEPILGVRGQGIPVRGRPPTGGGCRRGCGRVPWTDNRERGRTHSFSLEMRMGPPHRLPPRRPPPLMRRLERREARLIGEVVVRVDLHPRVLPPAQAVSLWALGAFLPCPPCLVVWGRADPRVGLWCTQLGVRRKGRVSSSSVLGGSRGRSVHESRICAPPVAFEIYLPASKPGFI